ncbi:fructosamine kinase family protein [Draconibacterium halophilum]|uniref:Fructosamine kinase family protein n=1 Tax=Draconibacterium halophilum TaxID=2706887 RepID=A0A6C0RCG7_9BACT|nr:fructosamine kinase family protein [Draconibacterium halophilum]QIA08174.1 fructosamine kinase family protein [Draconibacterium halophilum]
MIEKSIKIIQKEVEDRLTEVFGENVNIASATSLSGGCINHASKIDTNCGSFFLKWNSDCESDLFTREAESLNELSKATDGTVCVPKVFCTKEIDETPAFLVMEYMVPGATDQSERLGRGLALVHKYQQNEYGFYSDNYCGATTQNNTREKSWVKFYRDNRLYFLLKMIQEARGIDSSQMRLFESLLDRLEVLIPNEEKASLIHGDLWSGNYMLTNNGPVLIDPAASYSHREMEFGIVTMFGGFSSQFFAAYNEVFPLDSDWRERNQLYQLYHVLNHYYLFGGAYLSQAVAIAKRYL